MFPALIVLIRSCFRLKTERCVDVSLYPPSELITAKYCKGPKLPSVLRDHAIILISLSVNNPPKVDKATARPVCKAK